jgi:hypothetical protein
MFVCPLFTEKREIIGSICLEKLGLTETTIEPPRSLTSISNKQQVWSRKNRTKLDFSSLPNSVAPNRTIIEPLDP